MSRVVRFRIRRQDGPDAEAYWQEFGIPWREGLNVVSALMVIRANPLTTGGERVDPVAWEHNCMEEVCGACSMLINGRPRQACSTQLHDLEQPVVLEPLGKFPLVRDLAVDRSRMFEALHKVKAWIPLDGPYDIHERGPRISPREWQDQYIFSRCMTCGCCLQACPQYGPGLDFIGPAALAQAAVKNVHPSGRYNSGERLQTVMGVGGVSDCGNAQNCVQVCPKEIPLTTAIARLGRQASAQWLKDLLGA